DHRLVGEGSQQLHVMVREGAWLDAGDGDEADRSALICQRREQHAAKAARTRDVEDFAGERFGIRKLRDLTIPGHWKGTKLSSGLGNVDFRTSSASGVVGVKAIKWAMPSMKRNTVAEKPPTRLLARVAIASNTGCTSEGKLA